MGLASGIEGMPDRVVWARLRGEEAVEDGDSILVKDREVCRALGLLSRVWATSSDDMVDVQRWPKHGWPAL